MLCFFLLDTCLLLLFLLRLPNLLRHLLLPVSFNAFCCAWWGQQWQRFIKGHVRSLQSRVAQDLTCMGLSWVQWWAIQNPGPWTSRLGLPETEKEPKIWTRGQRSKILKMWEIDEKLENVVLVRERLIMATLERVYTLACVYHHSIFKQIHIRPYLLKKMKKQKVRRIEVFYCLNATKHTPPPSWCWLRRNHNSKPRPPALEF